MFKDISPSEELKKAIENNAHALHRELHADMRILRDTELKLVPFFFQITAFVFAANVFILAQPTAIVRKSLALAIGLLSVVFTVVVAWLLSTRIGRHHRTYRQLGDRVTYIQKVWGVHDFFDSDPPFGHGDGSRRNQHLIWCCALFVVLVIIVGLDVKHRILGLL